MTTKLAKHTPGPWTFYPDRLNSWPQDDKLGGIVSTGEDEWVVAEILSDCDTTETALANARLIAAAPAMLEALEDAEVLTKVTKAIRLARVGEKEENTQ